MGQSLNVQTIERCKKMVSCTGVAARCSDEILANSQRDIGFEIYPCFAFDRAQLVWWNELGEKENSLGVYLSVPQSLGAHNQLVAFSLAKEEKSPRQAGPACEEPSTYTSR